MRRLARGMSLALAGNLATAASQWLALLLLARWTSPGAVGEYALALAICGPLILFANLQLSGLQSTDARRDFSFEQYFALRLLTTSAAWLAIVAVSFLLRFDVRSGQVLALLAAGKCCEAVSDAVYGALMRRSMFARVSRALVLNAALSLAGFAAGAFIARDVRWAVAGWSAGSCLTLVLVTLPEALTLQVTAGAARTAGVRSLLAGLGERRQLGRLALTALPMGLISTLLSLQANVPQYVIHHALGSSAVGIFALLAYPFMAGNVAVTAMGQAAAPQFADAIRRDDVPAFRRVLLLTTAGGAALGLVVVAGAWLFGARLLGMLYAAQYSQYAVLFTTIAAGAAVRYAYLPVGVAVTAQRRLVLQVWLRLGVLLLTGVAVWAGVSWNGLQGAAFALACAAAAEGVVWFRIAANGLVSSPAPAPVPLPLT